MDVKETTAAVRTVATSKRARCGFGNVTAQKCVIFSVLMNTQPRVLAGIAICLLLPAAGFAQSAGSQAKISEYRARLRTFDARQPVTPETVAVVVEGLSSTEEAIRGEALDAVAAIASPLRALMAKLSTDAFHADAARLWPHEALVQSLLDDPSALVRAKAVEASATLRYSKAPLPVVVTESSMYQYDCGLDLAERFDRMYTADSEASVRSQIVRMLTGVSQTVPERTRVIVHGVLKRALDDPSWGTVNYALRDVVRRRLPGSLADSVRLLRHKDYQVRMVAAQMVASFGAEARPRLDDLRRAAQIETDDITRKTLLGSISVIEKSREATEISLARSGPSS